MLPIPKIVFLESTTAERPRRQPEPTEAMDEAEQVRSYVKAYEWGGPTSALQLHHLRELSRRIRPGDTVLDLACGHGPLILELAPLFPSTTFIGADLSTAMLEHLRQESLAKGLRNIKILQEDVRILPSLGNGQIDLVISTSALHHLPDEESLRDVFRRVRSLLKPDGGFYMFDFGLLKSSETRKICVAEVAKLAPPITARDYDLSLQAAFPIEVVFELAKNELPRPFDLAKSAFVDFFYFLQTPPRTTIPGNVRSSFETLWRDLSMPMKVEHLTLQWFRRTTPVKPSTAAFTTKPR